MNFKVTVSNAPFDSEEEALKDITSMYNSNTIQIELSDQYTCSVNNCSTLIIQNDKLGIYEIM